MSADFTVKRGSDVSPSAPFDDRVLWEQGVPVGFYDSRATGREEFDYVYFDKDADAPDRRLVEPWRLRWMADQIEKGEPFPAEDVEALAGHLRATVPLDGSTASYDDVALALLRRGVTTGRKG